MMENLAAKPLHPMQRNWEEFLVIACSTVELAVYLELRIKRMKSRKYIENLKKYPDLVDKITKEFDK